MEAASRQRIVAEGLVVSHMKRRDQIGVVAEKKPAFGQVEVPGAMTISI